MAITLNGSTGITSPGGDTSTSLSTGLLTVTGSTAPTNGLYLPTTNTLAWATNSTERLRLDASGNLGLGVTPSSWGSGWSSMQFSSDVSVGRAGIGRNVYYDGSTYKYISTAAATLFQQSSGTFTWNTAPSGTAGAAISFTQAMTLDASGNLLVGTTSTTGSTTNLTQLVGGVHSSLSGSGGSFTSGVAGTIFTMANINNGQTWLVTVTLDGEGVTSYNCTYVVVGEGANASVALLIKGANASISVSGLAVQYTQSSGGTKTNARWSAIRIL